MPGRVGGIPASYPETGVANGRDCLGRPKNLNARGGLTAEQVYEKFARQATDSASRFGPPNRYPLGGSRSLDFKPDIAQPTTQVAAPLADISPQRSLQCGREGVARA
jgi:hypothetical protein